MYADLNMENGQPKVARQHVCFTLVTLDFAVVVRVEKGYGAPGSDLGLKLHHVASPHWGSYLNGLSAAATSSSATQP